MPDALTSDLEMRNYSVEEMEASITCGTPMDKTGAIQDQEFRPGSMVKGCYTNVIGLPLCRQVEMLWELGFPTPEGGAMAVSAGCRTVCPFQRRSAS